MMLLRTDRLTIAPFTRADETEAIGLFMDPDFMIGSLDPPLDRDGARAKLTGYISHQEVYGLSKMALREDSAGRLVGYCGFAMTEIEGEFAAELGYRIRPDARGKGIATEAARTVIQDAFKRLKMPFVQAIVKKDNLASRRILEKLGLACQRTVSVENQLWLLYRLNNTI